MTLFNVLNKEQREAVLNIQGPLLVLAGAGTGKTRVITSRIAWMIKSGIPPESIVAVSFTNKAAHEMKERLCALVGEKRAKKVTLSTFHSFALSLLRQYPHEFCLQKSFSVADEGESFSLLKEALKEHHLEDLISLPVAKEKMSFFKDQLFTVEQISKSTHILEKRILSRLFDSYNRRLRLYNFVDFDDIVYLTVIGFKNQPKLLSEMQEKYRYLMVDEYQDTSVGQFSLIQILSEKNRNVCVVGDDDQSIYSWRGANPCVINNFLDSFPESKKVTLEQNYRCSPNILYAANAVIKENKDRLGKELWSQEPNKYPVIIHSAENERDEALYVMHQIEELIKEGIKTIDITILFRSSSQILTFEQVFIEKKIDYHVHGSSKFFDRKEVRDLLSYLKFANNETDLNSLFRIINLPPRGIGLVTLEKIKQVFTTSSLDKKITVMDALKMVSKEYPHISRFILLWEEYGKHLKNAKGISNITESLTLCYEKVGLKEDILQSAANMQVANFKTDLVAKTIQVLQRLELKEQAEIADVVDTLHLDESSFKSEEKIHGKIQMMTIHAAKGLEFPVVFLIGVEDGILPHEKSLTSLHGEQEERRLFYVAITRAKQRLYISHCGFRNHKKIPGKLNQDTKPSRFLKDIPNHLVQLSKTDPNAEESLKMDAARKLFELFR